MLQSRPPGARAAALLGLIASLALASAAVPARAQTAPATQAAPPAPQATAPAPAPTPGPQAAAQAAQEAYAVRDVEVDVTAASAAAARDQAIAEAQRKAFATLYRRLSSSTAAPPTPSDAQLGQLVQGLEVQRERSSAVRYVATLAIRFRPSAVRSFLQSSGVAILEPPSRPFLVLPVARVGGRPVLWEERTPWRAAWEDAVPGGYIPIVVPLGELADLTEIVAEEALGADRAAVEGIASRHGAGEVVVAVTDLPASGPVDPAAAGSMTLRRLRADGPAAEQTVAIPAAPGRTPEQYLAGGVAAALGRLEEDWKRSAAAAPESREERRLRVSVPIARLDDWVQTRQRLAAVPAVQRVELRTLSRTQAEAEIVYQGDTERLRAALAQRDLSLTPAPAALPAAAVAPALAPAATTPAPEVWQLRWNGSAAR
jgi:hypothetical protein